MKLHIRLMKLTFNAPAARFFFSAVDVVGVRIRLERNRVLLRTTVLARGMDVVSLSKRERGGCAAEIDADGTLAAELLRTFQRSGFSPKRPFFVLQSSSKGWIEVEHFASERAPPKHIAHMRVWLMAPDPGLTATQRPFSFDIKTWHTVRTMIFKANRTIKDYEATRQVGRPPQAVVEAQQIMTSFRRLVAELAVANKEPPASRRGRPEVVEFAFERIA